MIRLFLPFALCAALAACQSGTPSTPVPSPSPSAAPTETADTEGCEHLANGPATAVTTGATAPKVDNDHKRYDLTLTTAGTTVEFDSDEAAHYVLFLNKDIPVKVRELATSKTLALLESGTASTPCATVKGRHVVELGVGVYAIEFGPTTETQVSLVIEEEAGHGDDEHDHE